MKKLSLKFFNEGIEAEYIHMRQTVVSDNYKISLYFLLAFIAGTGIPEIIEGNVKGFLMCIATAVTLVLIAILAKFSKLFSRYVSLLTLIVMFAFNFLRFFVAKTTFHEMTHGKLYFRGYSFASLQIVLVARFFEFRQKAFGIILGFILRMAILSFLDQSVLEPELIIRHIAVDSFIIYTFYSNEKQERQIFENFYQSREGLVKFKELLTLYLPQSLIVVNSDVTKPLFANKKFSEIFDNFGVNNSFSKVNIMFQESQANNDILKIPLDELTIDVATIREIGSPQPSIIFSDSSRLRDYLEAILKGNTQIHKAWAVSASFRNNNHRKLFEIICEKIKWDDQNAVAVILNDVTYQEHLFVLKTSDANKDKILATVSHELRTPLNAITSILEICEKIINNQQGLEYIRLCKHNAILLSSLVNSLLDLHQINQRKFKLNPAPTDLRKVIQDMLDLFTFQAKNNAIHLDQKVSDDVPLSINTDENRLKQILINLIGNALKFTFSGSITIEAIQDPDNNEYIKISVCDTGIGIAEEDQKRLFRIYGKLEDKEGINKNGVGLGLTISKTLVEALSGKKGNQVIEIKSEVNVGSQFSFEILKNLLDNSAKNFFEIEPINNKKKHIAPVNESNSENIVLKDLEEFLPSQNLHKRISSHILKQKSKEFIDNHAYFGRTKKYEIQEYHSSPPLTKRDSFKILISEKDKEIENQPVVSKSNETNAGFSKDIQYILVVDDNPFNLMVAQNLIKETDFNVLTARNGKEAIEIARSATKEEKILAMILMDCQMPIMDGFETTKILKSMMGRNEIRLTPIVALTANSAERDIERCYESGMDEYICKPLTTQNLENMIAKVK